MKKIILAITAISIIGISCNKTSNILPTKGAVNNENVRSTSSETNLKLAKANDFFTKLSDSKKTRDGSATINISSEDLLFNLEAGLNIKLCKSYDNIVMLGTDVFEMSISRNQDIYDMNAIRTFLHNVETRVTNYKNTLSQTNPNAGLVYIDLDISSQDAGVIKFHIRGAVAQVNTQFEPEPNIENIYWHFYPRSVSSFGPDYVNTDRRGYCLDPENGNRVSLRDNTIVGFMSIRGRQKYITYSSINLNQNGYVFANIEKKEVFFNIVNDNSYRNSGVDLYDGSVTDCIGFDEMEYYMNKSNPKITAKLLSLNKSFVDLYWTYHSILDGLNVAQINADQLYIYCGDKLTIATNPQTGIWGNW